MLAFLVVALIAVAALMTSLEPYWRRQNGVLIAHVSTTFLNPQKKSVIPVIIAKEARYRKLSTTVLYTLNV